MEAELALAVSGRPWSEQLHRFVADHGGARVRTRVMSAEDATDESYDVLVVDDVTSFLSRRLVQQIQTSGRFVLGVYDPEESTEGKQRLLDLGVDDVIEASATPDEFLVAVRVLAASRTTPSGGVTQHASEEDHGPRGLLVVVGGPHGGTGATEIAIGLAVQLARRADTALVDGDDQAPALAGRLGLDLHPNLRTAVDAFHHGSGDPNTALVPLNGASVSVLAGLPTVRDWFDIRPGEVAALVTEIAQHHEHVIVNVGSLIEELDLGGGPARSVLARTLLRSADLLVGVGSPSPVGIARLLDWIAGARVLIERAPVYLVVNRASRSPYVRREIAREIYDAYTPADLVFAPEDPRVEAAAWDGRPVPRGPFTKALRPLARDIHRSSRRAS